MKDLSTLDIGDYIAFPFSYNSNKNEEIIVSNITSVNKDNFLVHFLYGHKSIGEFIKKENVIAIGDNENGTRKIEGWTGKFIVIKEHKLLLRDCPTCQGNGEAVFSCCTGESIDDELMMCPECKEHLGESECEDCEGTGKVTEEKANELNPPRLGLNSQSDFYKNQQNEK